MPVPVLKLNILMHKPATKIIFIDTSNLTYVITRDSALIEWSNENFWKYIFSSIYFNFHPTPEYRTLLVP